MRNVGLILRRELGSYLRTPSAYLIAAFVLLLDGLLFNFLALGAEERRPSGEVLGEFFYLLGIVMIVGAVLFSMRLLAEERATGTHTLLLTSPIREGEIVAGKYLASVTFLLILTLMSVYIPLLVLFLGQISWGHILCGYIGVFLMGATVLGIGTFASSMSNHPFVAVVVTAVVVVLMDPLSYLASQQAEADSATRMILENLALHSKHFSSFQGGIFQLSDVAFYLGVIYLCLLGATRVLRSQRGQ